MTTLYPIGYGTRRVTMHELKRVHAPKMHPEFSRRIWPWIESMNGLIGIGGGWRDTQPDKPGFAPDGKSFHQYQVFRSGIVAYCALDLVARDPGKIHRAPTWAESYTAPGFGLHTFIMNPEEPWHIQPIETRGWQTWKDAGSPDPNFWNFPEEYDMPLLPKPVRVYDSRNHNDPLHDRKTRSVYIGECSKASVLIGVVGQGGSGFLTLNGSNASIVNFSPSNPIDSNCVPIMTPGGHITVTAVAGSAHFFVDVYATAV